MASYNHKKIEKKWQKIWERDKLYRAKNQSKKQKYYQLETFPYPSAAGLHMGHPKGYIAEDIHARFTRMNGKKVLYTMGWDAFGLPTENYAIKIGKVPQEVAKANIKNFKRQVKMFGLSYDWQREINTSDPEYYKWTQWLFIQLFKMGLAFQKKAMVNWCPKDQTVLANEQVVDGKCERCGTEVIQKEMKQWFFKITDYAERLLSDLRGLTWPEETIKRQEDWVGKSEGVEIEFKINPPPPPSPRKGDNVFDGGSFGYHTTDHKTWRALQGKALEMRTHPTRTEEIMWQSLRRNLTGFHFRRQHIIGRFIVDFVCLEKLLVVEVDGDIHDYQKKEDEERTEFLKQSGFVVIRFRNKEILENVKAATEEIKKKLKALPLGEGLGGVIKVFTTRPDTLFGATYLVLAPEHKIIQELKSQIENWSEVKSYINSSKKKTELERKQEEKEKTGVELKGVTAINPATKEKIPVWVADYVLGSYGTGAIMAVPAHDQRDFEFAKKFDLPIKEAVVPNIIDQRNPPAEGKVFVERKNVHAIVRDPKTNKYLGLKWKKFDWTTFPMGGVDEGEDIVTAAKREVKEETGFVNIRLVKVIDGQVRAEYFAAHKNENRIAFTTAVVFELIDHKQVEISEKEKNSHDVIWLDSTKLNYKNMTHAEVDVWDERLHSKNPAYTGDGILINSGKFSGMKSGEAKNKITEFVGGKLKVQYKLRDWSVSRQRYWGVPIPVIYCNKCGIVPVPEKDLPVKLPALKNYRPKGKPPLASSEKFMKVKCPSCGGYGQREPETLDTFVDSSWYYLRYADPKNKKEFASKDKLKHWLPVDLYVIGAEHTTAHLLYARFIAKFLHDQGYLNFREPFLKLRHQGMILGPDGRRMSKRWGNVVNPDDVIAEYGADTARLYEMFMGPFESGQPWDAKGVIGAKRFLDRVWRLASTNYKSNTNIRIREFVKDSLFVDKLLHKTIKKVTEDIENFRFNTAISALMILLNEFEKASNVKSSVFNIFLCLLAPFAPHITEEIWHNLSGKGQEARGKSIHLESWPKYDPKLVEDDTFELIVQINGKVRDKFEAKKDISQKEAETLTFSREKVKNILGNNQPKKVIFVPSRLINLVV